MLHPINLDVIYNTSNINFSQGIYDDQSKLIFYSGIVGWDKNLQLTGDGSFEAQLDQCIINLKLLLLAQGLDLNSVIKFTIYVVGVTEERRKAIVQMLGNNFKDYKPANTLIGVASLARENLLVELDVVASMSSTH